MIQPTNIKLTIKKRKPEKLTTTIRVSYEAHAKISDLIMKTGKPQPQIIDEILDFVLPLIKIDGLETEEEKQVYR